MEGFHFSDPLWLLLLIPALLLWRWWVTWPRADDGTVRARLEQFIDPHLLPYLLKDGAKRTAEATGRRWQVSPGLPELLAACLIIVALAGPRWGYDEQPIFQRPKAMMVLLDLSRSMRASDVQPSRMERAKQELHDLLDAARAQGVSVGLVGFAATAHVLAPVTEGIHTIEALMPSLSPSLFSRQGSDPLAGLQQAADLLARYSELSGTEKAHIILLTDGDMPEMAEDVVKAAGELASGAVPMAVHVLTVGTEVGAPIPERGAYLTDGRGRMVMSRLDVAAMQAVAEAGQGVFVQADYVRDDTDALMQAVIGDGVAEEEMVERSQRIWHERFIIPLLIAMVILVWRMPRSVKLVLVSGWMLLVPQMAQAEEASHIDSPESDRLLGMRHELSGLRAFDDGAYGQAAEAFHDPYRKGVAYYRAGDYKAAEAMFQQSMEQGDGDESGGSRAYNLGNSLFQQGRLQEAVEAYQQVLEQEPGHEDARYNMRLAEALLRAQPNQPQQGGDGQQAPPQDGQRGEGEEQDAPQQADPSEQGQAEPSGGGGDAQAQPEQGEQSGQEQQQEEAAERSPSGSAGEGEQQDAPERDKEQAADQEEAEQMQQPGQPQPDPNAERLLEQLSDDPGELLRNRLDLEERRTAPQRQLNPW